MATICRSPTKVVAVSLVFASRNSTTIGFDAEFWVVAVSLVFASRNSTTIGFDAEFWGDAK
jgi:hypothetical protein